MSLYIARAVRVVRAIGSFIVGGERLRVRLLGGRGRDAAVCTPRDVALRRVRGFICLLALTAVVTIEALGIAHSDD